MGEGPSNAGHRTAISPGLLAGGFVVAVGLGALVVSLGYDFGTPSRMGPGFVPTLLCILLILLGIAIILAGPGRDLASGGHVRIRPLVCILGAILCFGLLVGRAGLVPAILVAVPVAALAELGRRFLGTALLSACIVALAVGIFVYGLGVPADLFGR